MTDKLRKYLTESSKFEADGKYITWGSSTASIPEHDRDTALVFDVKGESFYVKYYDRKGTKIYAFTDKYDKTFKNLEELVKWLNKNNAEYAGVDDYI